MDAMNQEPVSRTGSPRNEFTETDFTGRLLGSMGSWGPSQGGPSLGVGHALIPYTGTFKLSPCLSALFSAIGTQAHFFLKTWRSGASFPKHLYKKANTPPFFQRPSRPLHPSGTLAGK